ncbi:endolytic transglycosylase MltG [Candidatus Parcubacteria bacterium]|nr:MAG: endolytic transglycosylase MltG [Candidatus Parcubacteria bacterium]
MDELIRELKRQGVLRSPLVAEAFGRVDRKDFVRPEDAAEAYANWPLAIGAGQTISQPQTVAFMLDLLDPRPGERILDVGAGSGWQSALLAAIVGKQSGGPPARFAEAPASPAKRGESARRAGRAGTVVAIERIPELCRFAQTNLKKYEAITAPTVQFICGDATTALERAEPFDKIIAAAAAKGDIPASWRALLKPGGVIVAPVDDAIIRLTKTADGAWRTERFEGFAFVPLISGTDQPKAGFGSPATIATGAIALAVGATLCALAMVVPVILPGPVTLDVPRGAGSQAIGRLLESQGLVWSRHLFVAYAVLTNTAGNLKPGAYSFDGAVTIPEIIGELARGSANERVIVIPEGWDQRTLGIYLEERNIMPAERWWDTNGWPATDYRIATHRPALRDFSQEFAFLADKPAYVGLEGYLYPDTYRIWADASPEDIARRMLENFDEKLTPALRTEIARQGKTIFEVVTLASLVERETGEPSERPVIAGILWKRLSAGMPLQVDATVSYATGRYATPSGPLLEIDSPYNTYRYAGLPIGPIANPSIESITAALYPIRSAYWYYLHTPDGDVVFSKTLEEHEAAKARHRAGR